jgi:RNA polymerase sigma-70 factor (ECF subfamily)
MADQFHQDLIAMLPRLRVQALALTRNRSQADDLVQECVVRALAARQSFMPGTNFAAWLHRILRNHFISELRKRRDTVTIDDAPPALMGGPADAEDRIALRELWQAMQQLSPEHREALVMVAVEGMSYEQVSELSGVPVGTAKCRVFRARRQLQALLLGEGHAARQAPAARTEAAARPPRATRLATDAPNRHTAAAFGEPQPAVC